MSSASRTPRRDSDSERALDVAERVTFATTVVIFVVIAVGRLNSTALWVDEAWSLAAVNHLGTSLRATSGTMAAYYLILWPWGHISNSTWWLRTLSLVFGIATLFVLRAIGRRLGGRRLGVLAPLLLATSPIFLWMSTEARGYSLELLVISIAWYCVIRAIRAQADRDESRARLWWIVLAAVATVGPFVHGLFFVAFAGICALCVFDSQLWPTLRRLAPALTGVVVVSILFWMGSGNSIGAGQAGNASQLAESVRQWFVTPTSVIGTVLIILMIGGSVAALVKAGQTASVMQRMFLAIPTLWVWIPLVVLVFVRNTYGTFTVYYLSPIAPGVALLLAATMIAIGDGLRRRFSRSRIPTAIAAVFATALVVLLFAGQIRNQLQPNEDWRGAALLVASESRPGDVVIFGGDFLHNQGAARAAFEAAWREVPHGPAPISISPTRPLGKVRRVDHYPPIGDIRKRATQASRVWVVDFQHEMKSLKLTDRSPFTTKFRLVFMRELPGDIQVSLYENATPRSP